MTNFEKWQSFMSGIMSPQVYIDFGFYYLISAALQRRVWHGPDHRPLYPNQYIILVGEAGVGKGLVIKPVTEILRYHKLRRKVQSDADPVHREMLELLAEADLTDAERAKQREDKHRIEEPLLIPVAADATTYEALVTAMCRSLRRKDYSKFDEKLQKTITAVYTHSSQAFSLEELSSLMKKKADDVLGFLLVGFDCGDYKKDTKTAGVDKIHNMCVNFFAGTTPEYMQKTFKDGVLNEGMSSRGIFIFAAKPRFYAMEIPDLTPEQKQHWQDIVDQVGKLTQLYGRVTTDRKVEEFLQEWWVAQQQVKANCNEKLKHYYSRKNIHVRKLAMAIHFAESTSMELTLEEHVKAIAMLDNVELVMHHALVHGSANPLYRLGLRVVDFLEETGGATAKELLVRFWEELPTPSLKQVEDLLTHLLIMQKITTTTSKNCKGDVTKYLAVKETKQ